MESDTSDGQVETKAIKRFDSPVGIVVTSYRVRLCDLDGISAKAIIDGIVHRGILQDDGPEWVTSLEYREVKVKSKGEEKTVVEITEMGKTIWTGMY